MATRDIVAGVGSFLAGNDGRYLTGQALNVDGEILNYKWRSMAAGFSAGRFQLGATSAAKRGRSAAT